ncbi:MULTISPECIES: hypothetical protein [unclassified Bradyrhizobium]|uniref:hypothetical protein n=1 Tax=unclassified Bradyrhizobium TaxID=2631580 RepID=UPI001CD5A2FC|nr:MULTISPECIES: hypothetical protein [unclassified Bradyrhizobium]MCA1431160.1 hypothetical protein [Bradyrhizobium sp. NBAIM16]MCA1509062.1 hypothetical protein [Bradyrhizobium sp. NBAIM02]
MRVYFLLVLMLNIIFAGTACAAGIGENEWNSFRKIYPNHVQTIALSRADATGHCVLIISEPPSDTLPKRSYPELLKSVFRDHLSGVEIKKKSIGLGGWVEDLVVSLNGYSDPRLLNDDVGYLAQVMWGTTYKAPILDLSNLKPAEKWSAPLNVSIRHTELKGWLVDGTMKLFPVEFTAANPMTLSQLVQQKRTGTYFTTERGVVLLLIERNRNFEEYRADFRKFALDSDLVVGAIRIGQTHLALIGRERETSLQAMPPLRFETARLLATTDKAELAQSYERNQLFAGRLEKGEYAGSDWAPIYLSPELINSELGSTLNLTDQMLKSWSMAGAVQYHGFDYPVPRSFPFDGKPIMQQAQAREPKIEQTLFNWNTTGAYSLMNHPMNGGTAWQTLASLNSGSLPVIYKDESQPAYDAVFGPFEDAGYTYFRSLRDPLLARVTSYQVIFQSTRDHPLPTALPIHKAVAANVESVRAKIEKLLKATLNLAAMDENTLVSSCEIAAIAGEFRSADACKQAIARTVLTAAAYQRGSPAFRKALTDFLLDRNLGQRVGNVDPDLTDHALIDFGFGTTISLPPELEDAAALLASRYFVQSVRMIGAVKDDDRRDVFAIYSMDQAEDPDSYIQTARVVLSSNLQGVVGGHNLSGRTAIVETDSAVAPGSSKLLSRGNRDVIVLNPADADKAGVVARNVEKQAASGTSNDAIQAQLQKTLAKRFPQRNVVAALNLNSAPAAGRGLAVLRDGQLQPLRQVGLYPNQAAVALRADVVAFAKQLNLSVIVVKDGNDFVVICVFCGSSGQEMRALSQSSLRESVAMAMKQAPEGTEYRIYFRDFAADQVEAFQRTMAFADGPPLPPPPPGPPPTITGPAGEPPWRRGAGGGSGNSGNPGGTGKSGPAEGRLLIFKRNVQDARQIRIRARDGDSFRIPEQAEVQAAYLHLNLAVNWRGGTIKAVAVPTKSDASMSFELVVPREAAVTPSANMTGRLDIELSAAASPADRKTVADAAQVTDLKGSFREGVQQLIDRLRNLKVSGNKIKDVKFFFQTSTFDAVITENWMSSAARKRG